MSRRTEFEMIPTPAKVIAAFAAAVTFGVCATWVFASGVRFGFFTLIPAVAGLIAAACVAAYVLLAGYVYADAARRDMPPALWTALAILVPNCIGFVLYFLLRKPLLHPCPNCGGGVPANAAFCSRCGHAQVSAAA